MSFTRIRTIKGRRYRYLEERWRENGKVCSRSISLGPLDDGPRPGFLKLQFPPSYGFDWEKIEREELQRMQTTKANRDAALKDLHDAYGLVLGPSIPIPIEKISAPSGSAGSQEEAPAADEPDIQ
ncbi:MAG: hypothetical protein WB524_00375 [Acidobacteriaceae bacterium]